MVEKVKQTAIVRGMTKDWFNDHFKDMKVYFSGKTATPQKDADYIGFYLEAPDSAITHLGVVENIDRQPELVTFYLKAIIRLDKPVKVEDHAIRKQEYWSLEELGIHKLALIINQFSIVGGSN
ncbi:MAG: hypothetical protein R3F48_08385 [Candidatus Zixiibacteriota bacterium]